MAKRFLDTGFLDQKWIRQLSSEKKIFLIYLMLKCDNGGIIELDFEDASFWIGKKIDSLDFLPEGYLIPLNNSSKYFIPKFIEWQYSNFPHSKVHQQMQAKNILIDNNLFDIDNQCIKLPKTYVKFTQKLRKSYVTGNANANGNVNGIVKKGEFEGKNEEKKIFDVFRKEYPGTKNGLTYEFENFIKKHKDWKEVLPVLSQRLNYQKEARAVRKENKLWNPEWKHLSTWINQRGWGIHINTEE